MFFDKNKKRKKNKDINNEYLFDINYVSESLYESVNEQPLKKKKSNENIYREEIIKTCINYYENYNNFINSEIECFYCCDNFFKYYHSSVIYLKDFFEKYLKNTNNDDNIDDLNNYDIIKFIYYLNEEKKIHRNNDSEKKYKNDYTNSTNNSFNNNNNDNNNNDNNKISKNNKMKSKSRYMYLKLSFKKVKYNLKIYLIKFKLFSRNDTNIKKCSDKIKKNRIKYNDILTDEIELEYLGRYNEFMDNFIIRLECNNPNKEDGFKIYNIAFLNTKNFHISISQPFTTISHKQFCGKKDKSFIRKINNIKSIEYYFNGFCDKYQTNEENSIVLRKEFKFKLNFYISTTTTTHNINESNNNNNNNNCKRIKDNSKIVNIDNDNENNSNAGSR